MTIVPAAAARPGDLVLVERVATLPPYGLRAYAIERVTGVDPDGWTTETTTCDGPPGPFEGREGYVRHYLLRAEAINVEGLWATWCAREEDDRPRPFQTVTEAQEFVEPFRRAVAETLAASDMGGH